MNIKKISGLNCEVGTVRYTRPAQNGLWWGVLDVSPADRVWFGKYYGRGIEIDPQSNELNFTFNYPYCPDQGTQIVFAREECAPGKYRARMWTFYRGYAETANWLAQHLADEARKDAERQEAEVKAKAEAEERRKLPVYRVTRLTYWNHRLVTGKPETIIADGIIPELGGFAPQILRPTGGFSYQYRILRRRSDGNFSAKGMVPEEVQAVSQAMKLPLELIQCNGFKSTDYAVATAEQAASLAAVFNNANRDRAAALVAA
jgi:hypothetical protein